MTIARRHLALSAMLPLAWGHPAWAAGPEEEGDDQAKPEIVITGTLPADQSASSTGLPLTLRETPQSVTIIDRSRIDDFALTNVNDLLDQVAWSRRSPQGSRPAIVIPALAGMTSL